MASEDADLTSKIYPTKYAVEQCSIENVANKIHSHVTTGGAPKWLACLNPHSYVTSTADIAFQQALQAADWLVPDGIGYVVGMRFLGLEVEERITGSDIFYSTMAQLNSDGNRSVYFVGGTEATLAKIRAKVSTDYPRVRFAGSYSPPFVDQFDQEECEKIVAKVNASDADVLWVGMTAPKQEKWIHGHNEKLMVSFSAAIGAVFDFYTGQVQRSHPIFQKLGLEWLPRMLQEPKRLWRRNFVSTPLFVVDILKEKYFG